MLMLKRAQCYCALFLFLASCNESTGPNWTYDSVCGSDTHSVLILSGDKTFKDLELEVQKTNNEKRIYLNTYGVPFSRNSNGKVDVIIRINDNETRVEAMPLQGSQSVRLPSETENILLEAIENRDRIFISIGRYSTEIHYDNFDKHFKKFCND